LSAEGGKGNAAMFWNILLRLFCADKHKHGRFANDEERYIREEDEIRETGHSGPKG
jgi:hypothetical protein